MPLSVERYLLLARFAHRRGWQGPSEADGRSVDAALAATELGPLRGRTVTELSGGERQLVQLAGALVQGGDTWLVDEPTAHLDPAHQRRVARLLGELLRRYRDRAGDPAYNLIVHSAPRGRAGSRAHHWFIQLRPRIHRTAGFELATGVHINPSLPESDARVLRGEG